MPESFGQAHGWRDGFVRQGGTAIAKVQLLPFPPDKMPPTLRKILDGAVSRPPGAGKWDQYAPVMSSHAHLVRHEVETIFIRDLDAMFSHVGVSPCQVNFGVRAQRDHVRPWSTPSTRFGVSARHSGPISSRIPSLNNSGSSATGAADASPTNRAGNNGGRRRGDLWPGCGTFRTDPASALQAADGNAVSGTVRRVGQAATPGLARSNTPTCPSQPKRAIYCPTLRA